MAYKTHPLSLYGIFRVEMGKASMSAVHLLVLLLVLNVGLVVRLGFIDSESTCKASPHGALCESLVLANTLEGSMLSSFSSSSSSFFDFSTQEHGNPNEFDDGRIINLDQGDPTMYESFWQLAGEKADILIPGWQSLSYFSDTSGLCWFLEPELAREIVRLHGIVGNAVTHERHIVVGTGSTQLLQAALHALSPSNGPHPVSVVAATPYYSFYKNVLEFMKSRVYKWEGDASEFNGDGPYIELVTSPNNPDGLVREPVLNRPGGALVHDFAYYWPQYTAITSPADQDIMLYTVSKITGHAGTRIGWALVKDEEVARRMVKFIMLSSIGVSKDSQLRAAKILGVVSDTAEHAQEFGDGDSFFEFSQRAVEERWIRLRKAVNHSGIFSLPDLPSAFCRFFNRSSMTQPAFAWIKCEGQTEDCEGVFKAEKILARGGAHFGVSPRFVRINMLESDENFNTFLKRLSEIRH